MCEITIPSSPSWYLSNILACNDEGTAVAYGAKHEIVILVQTNKSTCELQTKFIPMAHKDRITAVAFAPSNSEFKNNLVSCSEDGSVHVWDWTTHSLLLSHSGHPDGHKIVGADWSRADADLVVSITDLGSIVIWDIPSNTIRRLQVGPKILPICLSCCPHNKDLIAIGAKGGLVIIYNIKGDGFLNFRLRGHDSDVVSLAWCPVPYNVFLKEENEKTKKNDVFLLASGSKGRSIYFWKAGTDGRYETFLNLPSHTFNTNQRSKNGVASQGTNWICVRWPSPHNLITSSLFGELLSYDLKEMIIEPQKDPTIKKPKNKLVRLLHNNHNKGLFSVAVPSNPLVNVDEKIVWSFALDKHIIACKLDSGKIVKDMTTIGGIVYCMALSPLDPNRIAIGTGDNRVLIWNMSDETGCDISAHWSKINAKVMAVAWHPTQDSLLAFGTGEGRVGLMDTTGSRPSILLRFYHRKSVYSLIWAPPVVNFDVPKSNKNNLALFSVGDGDIVQYDTDAPEKDPVSLNSFFKACDASAMVSKSLGRTDLCWKYDQSLAAVGNDNGVLYIVDGQDFGLLHTIFAHKKLVQCIVWHPGMVTSENSISPYASWLASASDNIQIINVTNEGVETVGCLNTHTERIVSLAWSPHFNARLVSASYDYTSQVWDVVSGSVLACFDGHHSAVVCCLPSNLHQDYYITGAADNTVRVWNMNKYNLTKAKTKKQRLSGVLKKFASVQEATASSSLSNSNKFDSKHEITKTEYVQQTDLPSKERTKSMFPVTGSGISSAKCLDILWARLNGTEMPRKATESGYLDFFGDTKAMNRLMMVEGNYHQDCGNVQYTRHLSLWAGNLNQTIIDACRKKQLDPWLVALAPMVSHKLWVDCCKSYASQLAERGDIYQAVSYLLGIHQVEEAIQLFLDSKMFREAVAVAKARLPPNDPTVKKAMALWATHCTGNGMLNLAAHCLLNNGSYIEAVEILSRTKDAATLALAAEIACKSEAHEMGLSLAMRAVNTSLMNQDYKTARHTVTNHNILKDLVLWIDVCSLVKEWQPVEIDDGLSWVCGTADCKWNSIFDKAVEMCNKLVPSYSVLTKFLPNKPTPDSEHKIWTYVCGQISLAATSNMQPLNSKGVLKHLLQGMEAAYNYYIHNPGNPRMYLQLAAWIAPKGPFSELTIYSKSEKCLVESVQTFLACNVIYWVDLLNQSSKLPCDDTEQITLLNSILKKCAQLLFSKTVLSYQKMDVEIKKLENSIAAAKLKAIQANKSMKHCKDIEAQLQGVTNGVSDVHLNGDTKEFSDKETIESEEDKMKKLTKIRMLKTKFEEERICAPNPFITYCALRNILQSIILKNCESSKETLNEVVKIWETASAEEKL